jgi:hypothetical protein
MPPTGSKTLDDWIAPRRAAAIARIVKAVGQPPRDEMLMAADIFQASCEKPSALVLQEGSQAQAREKGATHSQKRGKASRIDRSRSLHQNDDRDADGDASTGAARCGVSDLVWSPRTFWRRIVPQLEGVTCRLQ